MVSVDDPAQQQLQPSQPYQRTKAFDRYSSAQMKKASNAWTVPGQRPINLMPGLRLPSRLPQYPVPEKLRKCILQKKDVTEVAPVLMQVLCARNYSSRFSTLLHLEEIQQDIDIHEYDLDHVILRRVGEFLALRVPGLAEGRPSLLIGDSVILSNIDYSEFSPSYQGYIHEILKEDVLLKFSNDFHLNYQDQQYNVQFTYNRNTLRRCHMAVEFAQKLCKEVTFPIHVLPKLPQTQNLAGEAEVVKVSTARIGIRHCPLGSRSTVVTPVRAQSIKLFNGLLNKRQQAAVQRVLEGQCRPMPYIIFGPPGTGKTVTVVEGILQVFHNVPSSRILACAPSNSAADLLTERLHDSLIGLHDMVRLNAFRRLDESILNCIRPYCFDGEDVTVAAAKRIVVCTCSTAGIFYGTGLSSTHFTHVFVDEAGQATEPECMIPIGLVAAGQGQVVLAGDPLQLGPVLRSTLTKEYGLQISYLERMMALPLYQRNEMKFANHGSYDPLLVTKLVENYRSHPALIKLSSDIFYNNELVVSAEESLVRCLCPWDKLPNHDFPVLFHGIRGEDVREGNSPSWFNAQEAVQVMKYLQSIVSNNFYQLTFDDIGIITPYRKQVEKIRLLIDRLGMEKVKVGSVEEFQGQERLAMIISTVRSQDSLVSVDLRYTLGFLSNPKRFNVAITRAHALLVIVGNPHVLAQDIYWYSLIKYCVANGSYVGCDPPDLGPLSLPPGSECRNISSFLTMASTSDSDASSDPLSEGRAPDGADGFGTASNELESPECCGEDGSRQAAAAAAAACDVELTSDSQRDEVHVHDGKHDESESTSETTSTEVNLDTQKSQDICLISNAIAGTSLDDARLQSLVEDRTAALSAVNESHDDKEDFTAQQSDSKLRFASLSANYGEDPTVDINCHSDRPCDDSHVDFEFAASPFDMVPSPVKNAKLLPVGEISNRFLSRLEKSGISVGSASIGADLESVQTVRRESTADEDVCRHEFSIPDSVHIEDDEAERQSSQTSGDISEADLEKRIIRQMEYYFGDFNMMKDAFLLEYMKKDPDGWIPLSVIVSFNRMKALSTDFAVIVSALKKSTSELIEISSDEQSVRRSSLRPLVNDTEIWKADLRTRAVVIEKYPLSETFDQMQEFFEKYGSVAHIERRIPKYTSYRGTRGIDYVDLIIYHKSASARGLLRMRLTTLKRMGIYASYSNQFTDECIDYFFAKKVKCVPRSELRPVKWRGSGSRPSSRACSETSHFSTTHQAGDESAANASSAAACRSSAGHFVPDDDWWDAEERPPSTARSLTSVSPSISSASASQNCVSGPAFEPIGEEHLAEFHRNREVAEGETAPVDSSHVSPFPLLSPDVQQLFANTGHNVVSVDENASIGLEGTSSSVTYGALSSTSTLLLPLSANESSSSHQNVFDELRCGTGRGRGFMLAEDLEQQLLAGADAVLQRSGADDVGAFDYDIAAGLESGYYADATCEYPTYMATDASAFYQRPCYDQLDDDIIVESCIEEILEDDDASDGTVENVAQREESQVSWN